MNGMLLGSPLLGVAVGLGEGVAPRPRPAAGGNCATPRPAAFLAA
ncbi:hypothetical protein [Streptomyces sp. Ag109_G2-15]|nr:hypothetical protein [Streptomyces sp. Ag109_G2-15]